MQRMSSLLAQSRHRLVRCTGLLLTQADSLHPAMLLSTLITDHLKNIG